MKMLKCAAIVAVLWASMSFPASMSFAEPRASAKQIEREAVRQQKQQTRLPLAVISETQHLCAGPVPPGWIKVNDSWNPMMCGKPTSITYNVWTIERYSNKPTGFVMQACSGPAPAGWIVVSTNWNPTACGHPTSISGNMMTIKRVN
jgi:hypothetical protein